MAIQRASPYKNFNFLVDFGHDDTEAGFSEVLLPEGRIDVIEYRNGNDRENEVHKLPGLTHYRNAVFRRGLTGSLELYQWWNRVRNGDVGTARTVTVYLQNEDHTAVVMTWKLLRAWPTAYKGPALNGKGQDVAIEEIVLAFERLEIE